MEKVVGSAAAMIGEVDAILLAETSEDGRDHASLALPFLEAGMPVAHGPRCKATRLIGPQARAEDALAFSAPVALYTPFHR